MQQLQIGIQLASLRQPFKKALLTAARLGAQAVEIDARNDVFSQDFSQTGLRQLRKMLEDLNLRVCAVGFHTRRGYGEEADLDRRVAATKRAMQLAYSLGARTVANQIGAVPEDSSDPTWSRMVDVLTDLGRFGQHVGAFLAAETGAESATVLNQLLTAIPEGFVAVDLNPARLIINGFSPREAAELLGPRIMQVHANDAVPDSASGRGAEVTLGRGMVEMPELLGVLEHFQYRGALIVERRECQDPEQEIESAVEYVRHLLN